MEVINSWQEAKNNFVGDLENFLRWPECVKRFVVTNEYVGDIEFRNLDLSYWKNFIEESNTGNPLRAPFYQNSSINMIHYAYHVDTFQRKYNKKIIDYDLIVEFGGGYGGMCRLIKKMGFNGKYVIYDLPEVTKLQQYYLEKENCLDNVILTNDDSVFNEKYDLLIATWSLSEIPLKERDRVIKSANDYLMAFQVNFDGIDNAKYFNDLKIDVFPIEHLVNQYYCMGINR